MCGIVGYVGKHSALQPVLSGLKTLEYRGYDSAGIVTLDKNVTCSKQLGSVAGLEQILNKKSVTTAHTAIGHTRWATHGEPSIANAHPHFNKQETIYVVHNGIIENYQTIKTKLEEFGYSFISDTDTEVIPHLIDWHLQKLKNFEKAFEATINELEGAYAIAACYAKQPDKIYVARLSSPLVVGVGESEYIIASDATAISETTKKVVYLDDYDVAVVTPKKLSVKNLKEKRPVKRATLLLDNDTEKVKLGDYDHFMIKEIHDIPETIRAAIRGRTSSKNNNVRLGGLSSVQNQLRFIDRIVIVACGTSYYAGMVGEYLIEEVAGIPVEVQLASEFKYRNEPFSRGTAVLAISQSGETADTLAALKKVEQYGVLCLGVVNVVGSSIARVTDAGVYCHAGPELSVASTKAFVSQVTILLEIALYLCEKRTPQYRSLLEELEKLPTIAQQTLKLNNTVKQVAEKYARFKNFLYIGRGVMYPCALEGALKLKEVSYVHAEGYAAGEMKHGPLAMIDENFPTFAIATKAQHYDKVISNIEEIRARKGPVIAIATNGDTKIKRLVDDVIFVPEAPEQLAPQIVAIVMQLFAYHIAVDKGLNVDRPRNLAKSVTVE